MVERDCVEAAVAVGAGRLAKGLGEEGGCGVVTRYRNWHGLGHACCAAWGGDEYMVRKMSERALPGVEESKREYSGGVVEARRWRVSWGILSNLLLQVVGQADGTDAQPANVFLCGFNARGAILGSIMN